MPRRPRPPAGFWTRASDPLPLPLFLCIFLCVFFGEGEERADRRCRERFKRFCRYGGSATFVCDIEVSLLFSMLLATRVLTREWGGREREGEGERALLRGTIVFW